MSFYVPICRPGESQPRFQTLTIDDSDPDYPMFAAPASPIVACQSVQHIVLEGIAAYQLGITTCPVGVFGVVQGTNPVRIVVANISGRSHRVSSGPLERGFSVKVLKSKAVTAQFPCQPPRHESLLVGSECDKVLEPLAVQIHTVPDEWVPVSKLREGLIRVLVACFVDGKYFERECTFFNAVNLESGLTKVKNGKS